jgi:HK97 family phage prohead protease
MHETTSVPLREVCFAQTDDHAFSGYGAVFGNKDAYGDVIEPGAFADTLALAKSSGQWPAMLMQHGGMGVGADDLTPIGVWTELAEDSVGLRVSGKLADTPRGREAYALLKMEPRPAITGLSIGYVTKQSERGTRPDEPRRYLKKLDLLEISLVTFPANPRARVESVKGVTRREIERMLTQDAGLSRSQAREILARRFGPSTQDAGPDPADALRRLVTIIQP